MPDFTALWDTGATICMVSQAIVDACGLVEVGATDVSHAMGTSQQVALYYISLRLPSGAVIDEVRAIKGILPEDLHMVIGMNVINEGDFVITNRNGRTKFSFRVPSQADIDFVTEDAATGGTPT
ncbi:MAG: hypothetical protein OXC99_08725 [Chloroflexi bacterium]|nr:hypothetical protein [Chloroflexota bacterium]